jgi:CRISPR-associated protein Csh1
MIEAIHSLGQYALKEKELNLKNTDHLTEILIEDPASNPSYKKVLKISIKKNGDTLEFGGIVIDDYDSGKKGRLLYKKGDPSGTDFTPTSRITTPEKTFNRLLKWFTKNHSNNELKEDEKAILTDISLILNKNRKK